MHVLISNDGNLSLEDADNFKGFSIVVNHSAQGTVEGALASIAEPDEEDHFWLNVDSIITLSRRANDSQWVDAFWQMLHKAAPYGFYDSENKRVKAHVETG